MKIALAQINPTIGAIDSNLHKIIDFSKRAKQKNAELCVFPELAITGYPPLDLLERTKFVEQSIKYVEELAKQTIDLDMGILVGCIQKNPNKKGKPLQNCGVFIFEGKIQSVYEKTLLPNYDVFDEKRYFEPAKQVSLLNFKNKKLGITICEDIWTTSDTPTSNLYNIDPVEKLISAGAQIIINLSASPFTLEKREFRPNMLKSVAQKYNRPIVFVNQVGGNDELLFDGHSLAISANGTTIARAKEFCEDLVIADLSTNQGDINDICKGSEDAAFKALVMGTKDYAEKCGFKSAILGLSGGIDSAIVAAIAAEALGKENVYCVAMPTRYSSDGSLKDAEALVENIGVDYSIMPIDNLFQEFLDKLNPVFYNTKPDATEENIQARIRGIILMALSNKFGHLLLTTGNKSEMATGYCTLYGDMAGGLAVISDVPKTLIFRLCEFLNQNKEVIPKSIINKPPSAELKEDQKDEDSLPPYPVLDGILNLYLDKNMDIEEIIQAGYDEQIVREIVKLVKLNEYKRRQAPPGLKITSKAFGSGRRIPMAQRWLG